MSIRIKAFPAYIAGVFSISLVACVTKPPAQNPVTALKGTETTSTTSVANVPSAYVPQAVAMTADPEDSHTVALSSSISKVTVFSDRALVTRVASAKLSSTATVFAFKQLPGWVDDGSVRVSTNAGRILDVRVQRGYLARAHDPAYRKAEADAREANNRLGALDDEIRILEAQHKQVEDIKAFSLEKLQKDVVTGNTGVSTYSGVVDFVSKTLRETAKTRRTLLMEREKISPEVDAIKKRLTEQKGLTQLEETVVYVTLEASGPTDGRLSLSYMLPGATWEPMHELRVAESDPNTVDVASFAVVTQTSGEDWANADLSFSTQSSSTAVRIPELEALTLGDSKTMTQIMERQSASFSRAESAFRGQNHLWNRRFQAGSVSSNFEKMYQSNYEYLQVTQSKTVEIFRNLHNRGTTAQFKATTSANVRADGHSVRVPIGKAALKASHQIVAAPEQSLNAARTLEMLNESGQPLLPGNVALHQDGAFLGVTKLDFVAEGERFSVFLNVADQLKLSRTLDKKHSSILRKQHTQMQLAFIITVENLSSKDMTLTLADRIPVSEEREIVISGVRIKPDGKPDSRGIIKWPVMLKGKEKRRYDIQYQIEYPPTLILEARRSPPPADNFQQQSPFHPSPSRSYELKNKIHMLESAF